MNGLETTAIVLIALIAWYVLMMVISIILAKTNHPKAARVFKAVSILNYPFKKLDDWSIHVDNKEKLRTQASRYVVDKVINSSTGRELISEAMKKPVEPIAEPLIKESKPEPMPTPAPTPVQETVSKQTEEPKSANNIDVF